MSTHPKATHLTFCIIGILTIAILRFPAVATAKTLETELIFEGKVYYNIIRTVQNMYTGDMTSISVTAEEPVKKDQVLGMYELEQSERSNLRQRISKEAIESKEYQIEEAATKLQIAEKKLADLQQLYAEGMQSRFQVDTAQNLVEQQRQRLDFSKRQLLKQKKSHEETTALIANDLGGISLTSGEIPESIPLISPIDGHVLEWRDTKLWENMPRGTICFKVANIRDIVVKARVFVEDYPKLALDMQAEVTSTAYPDKTFQATLSKIPLTPIDKGYAALSYYLVEFEMDNSDMLFREGNSVTIKLPPQTVETAADLPAEQINTDGKDKSAGN